jgi:3',5'-cyclic AMP phosphodiesterase CpdA
MYILHLSDLHFGTADNATNWHNQLAEDLRHDLYCHRLDGLILSGDIANKSLPEEYAAAQQFLDNLCQEFLLTPKQVVIVPGNHDLNWDLAESAYELKRRKDYKGSTDENDVIDKGDIIEVQNPEEYKHRFKHFSAFYETLKGEPYPLEYAHQGILHHFEEQNLLILGLNSAWQLDHHYTSRASILPDAISHALSQIRQNSEYENCLKFAVWHHPLNSAFEDRITDLGFMQRLAQAGFRAVFHGHIHKAETSLYRYDQSVDGRKINIVCAGTFGAPIREWMPGYPLQYNLLQLKDDKLIVHTRCRRELNGAWQPDAIWTQGAGQDPKPHYEIELQKKKGNFSTGEIISSFPNSISMPLT